MKRSHRVSELLGDFSKCSILVDNKRIPATSIRSITVSWNGAADTIGNVLEAEGVSQYPGEIRYGEVVRHYPAEFVRLCAVEINRWVEENQGCAELSLKKSEFERELRRILKRATSKGQKHIEVSGKELHIEVGGYPNHGKHRMPICCGVMREHLQDGDTIISEPPKGEGATLRIRYVLPRGS